MRLDPRKLRKVRQGRLVTQEELSARTGLAESTINKIEGGVQTPRISTIRKLAAALDVPPEELITWAPPRKERLGGGKKTRDLEKP